MSLGVPAEPGHGIVQADSVAHIWLAASFTKGGRGEKENRPVVTTRSGRRSVKPVASAAREGSAAVRFVHQYLSQVPEAAEGRPVELPYKDSYDLDNIIYLIPSEALR